MTCVTITCDGCGAEPDDEFDWHYPSAEAAVADLVREDDPERSWSVDGDRHLCPGCVCERDGHLWDEPRRCRCGGMIGLPGHSGDCAVWSRWCARCVTVANVDPPESGGATA